MKKLFISIMISILFICIGCQNNNVKTNSNDNVTINQEQEDSEANKDDKDNNDKEVDKYVTLNLGELKKCNDIIEVQFNSSEWLDSIMPSNTSSVYAYYEDIEGESYFVLKGTIKNVSSDTIDIRFGSFNSFTFNNKYTYTGVFDAEGKEKSDFNGYQLAPLTSANCYLYVSVPDEVRNNYENCDIKLGFSDLRSYVYDEEDCTNLYKISLN